MQKYRDSTKRNYYTIWKSFNAFLICLDCKPRQWDQRIALFVTHLINEKRQSATIKSYVSAIRAILQDNDITINDNQFLITSLTKACKLVNDRVQLKLPIQKEMLSVIVRQDDRYYTEINQPYLRTLYSTLLIAIYFGLFRIGELTETPSKYAVLAHDVRIASNKNKISFVLRTYKTHGRNNKPQVIKI